MKMFRTEDKPDQKTKEEEPTSSTLLSEPDDDETTPTVNSLNVALESDEGKNETNNSTISEEDSQLTDLDSTKENSTNTRKSKMEKTTTKENNMEVTTMRDVDIELPDDEAVQFRKNFDFNINDVKYNEDQETMTELNSDTQNEPNIEVNNQITTEAAENSYNINETEVNSAEAENETTTVVTEEITDTTSTDKKLENLRDEKLEVPQKVEHDHIEQMSPFLPEIENDTLIHILRSDVDHHGAIYHKDDTLHETENAMPTHPPRLDNDQMNTTNPEDLNPVDVKNLSVIPFIPERIMEAQENTTDSLRDVPVTDHGITEITTNPSLQDETTTPALQETTLNSIKMDEKPSKDTTTITPDILNNIHSNKYFDEIFNKLNESTSAKTTVEQELQTTLSIKKETDVTEVGEVTEVTEPPYTTPVDLIENTIRDTTDKENAKDINISTEDLIAMETSTFGLKEEKNKLSIKVKENNIQLRADVIQTVTEIINVVDDENSNYTNSQENTVTEESEAKVTDNKHQYEVSEAISDITTPHVLLLKNTNNKEVETTPHDIIQPGGDDEAHLRVIPLQENDNSKLDQTITEDESFNSLGNELNRLNNVEEEMTKKELYEKKSKSDKQFDKPISDEEPVSQKEVDNVKPVTEGFILNGFSRCAIGQFQCVNGTSIRDGSYCIAKSDRCDSVNDCSDGSDEIGCVDEKCPNNFQCKSGQCIKRHLVCDEIVHCNDGSDEIECDTWQCNFDEFQCETKGRCIPLSWKCDGRTQCPQGNDEHNCHNSFCKNNEFQCVQQDTCVPLSWRCDGKSDCTNDEDEKLCDCGIDQFKCAIGGGCISQEYVCDGIEQCADRSDEWNCMKIDQLTSNSSDTNENNTNKYLMTKYNRFEFDNDIVLIRLISPMMLGENVSAICLPRTAINTRQVCVTAGWSFNKPQVGIIGTPEAQPVEEGRQFTSASVPDDKVSAASIFGLNDRKLPSELATTDKKSPSELTTTVPSTLMESQITLENVNFTPELKDPQSSQYQELARNIEEHLEKIFDEHDARINVKVMDFSPGSVVARYRTMWLDPIELSDMQKKIKQNAPRRN
ncbi:low-density lipoprotein receptor-related [Holotrichia oblita]|uniref:Low-density lipoprotein receptor-related n=1 Tax=Holotrichia oblita TaxID=644536 RepID=A0ACB9TGS5_HOLOL|nr:low-density lipoprotein receptor-related [Holotrichia oblita]